jgi:hypothetical protein
VAVEERWSAPAGEREAYGIAISRCPSRALLAPRGRPRPSLMSSPGGLAGWLVMCFASLARSAQLPRSVARACLYGPLCLSLRRCLPTCRACRLRRAGGGEVVVGASSTRRGLERAGVAGLGAPPDDPAAR